MTDFFSTLGDHLEAAAKRQAGGRRPARVRGPQLRALAVGAAVVLIVVASVAALPRIGGDETERAAGDGTDRGGWTAYPAECKKQHSVAVPVEGGPFPEAVRARFSVLAADSPAETVRPAVEGFAGLPIWGLQTKEARLAARRGDTEVYILAVADVRTPPEDCGPVPERPASEREPGVCLLLQGPKAHAAACWTLATVDRGESVLGPRPFELLAAAVPDGHPTVLVGSVAPDGSPEAGGTADVTANVGLVEGPNVGGGPIRWQDFPPDAGAPADYGCDGPVHPETLAAYSVLRNEPDGRRFDAPEGITFLSGPVLAREEAGHRFWLIPAAQAGDCAEPLICVVTDFGSEAVACDAVPPDADRTTPLVTRIEPGGTPNLVVLAAVPDGATDMIVREGVESLALHVKNNLAFSGVDLPDPDARQLAEAVGGKTVRWAGG